MGKKRHKNDNKTLFIIGPLHCSGRIIHNQQQKLSLSQFVFDKRSCFLYFCSHWMRGDDQSMQISMYFIKFWSLSYFLYQQNIARIFQEANTVLNMNWSIKKNSLRAELRAPLDFGFEIFHLHCWDCRLVICFSVVITHMIFVKTFTLADFWQIIFDLKAHNSWHIIFRDKTA